MSEQKQPSKHRICKSPIHMRRAVFGSDDKNCIFYLMPTTVSSEADFASQLIA